MYDPDLAQKINDILFSRFGCFCGETSEHIAEVVHEFYETEEPGVLSNGKHTA